MPINRNKSQLFASSFETCKNNFEETLIIPRGASTVELH